MLAMLIIVLKELSYAGTLKKKKTFRSSRDQDFSKRMSVPRVSLLFDKTAILSVYI